MNNLVRILLAAMLVFSFSSAKAAVENYEIDPMHSYILWHINHFYFSMQSGKWMIEGKLKLDEQNIENSKVSVIVPMANVVTGVPRLDKHLKNKDFFDVEKYPTATFISNKIEKASDNMIKVYGILTIKGISKPMVLNVRLNRIEMGPVTQKKTAGFYAETKIKRSHFGMRSYLPSLGDDVVIEIEVEATKV